MKNILLLAILIGSFAFGDHLVCSYNAKISQSDHYNSRGIRLDKLADILQQDRANYYKYGIRDPQDSGSGCFDTKSARQEIKYMVANSNIPLSLSHKIIYSTPTIKVNVFYSHIDILSIEKFEKSDLEQSIVAMKQDALSKVSNHSFSFKANATVVHEFLGIYFSKDMNSNVAWIVIASKPNKNFDYHTSVPAISIFAYKQLAPKKWQLYAWSYDTIRLGSGWGNTPSPDNIAIVHISPTKAVLAIESGYSNMGWGMDYYTLIAVGRDSSKVIFNTTIQENNGGTMDPNKTNWNSQIKLKPSNGKYYTINIHRRGISDNTPIDYTIEYHFDGNKYVTDKKEQVTLN